MTTGWRTIDVQMAFSDDPLIWTPTWTSILPDVKSIKIIRGWQPGNRFSDTGSLVLGVDDSNGNYNPANSFGSHFGALTSYRQVRVTATDSGNNSRTMFRGHVKPRGYASATQLPGSATATMSSADIMQMLARYTIPALAAPDAGAPVGTVFANLLAAAGFTTDWYNFLHWSLGSMTYTDIAGSVYGDNLLSHLQTLSSSDGGVLYVDQNGVLQLEQRLNAFFDSTRASPQYTFADNGTGGAILFERDSLAQDYAYDVLTEALYTGASGNPQDVTAAGVGGITGITNVDQRTLYCRDDPEVHARAELALALYGSEYYGPIALRYEACESNTAFDAMLNLDLRERVEVFYTPPNVSTLGRDLFAERMEIDIPIEQSPNTATVTLGLTPAGAWDQLLAGGAFLALDNATTGKLNTGRLAP